MKWRQKRSYIETKKYMDELIDFMNDTKIDINPLIKTAIIHSQFESIHPFDDGNGRVGRLLISLCLYKFKVIKIIGEIYGKIFKYN